MRLEATTSDWAVVFKMRKLRVQGKRKVKSCLQEGISNITKFGVDKNETDEEKGQF